MKTNRKIVLILLSKNFKMHLLPIETGASEIESLERDQLIHFANITNNRLEGQSQNLSFNQSLAFYNSGRLFKSIYCSCCLLDCGDLNDILQHV